MRVVCEDKEISVFVECLINVIFCLLIVGENFFSFVVFEFCVFGRFCCVVGVGVTCGVKRGSVSRRG